jgi:hypothetical protein
MESSAGTRITAIVCEIPPFVAGEGALGNLLLLPIVSAAMPSELHVARGALGAVFRQFS